MQQCSASHGQLLHAPAPITRRIPSRRHWWLQPPPSCSKAESGLLVTACVQGPGCASSATSSRTATCRTHHATPCRTGRPAHSSCMQSPSQAIGRPATRSVSRSSSIGTERNMMCRSSRPGRPMAIENEPDIERVAGLPMNLGGNPYWWEELGDAEQGPEDLTLLTPEEVDDRVEEAAALISVLDDLRPMQQEGYNSFAEVWVRLARVPPRARVRLVDEIEPGALRALWHAAMARYVLPDGLALQLLDGFSVLQDFPTQPGEVVEYEGCAERWQYKAPDTQFSVDQEMQGRYPRSAPWLRPNQGRMLASRKRFTQHFFLHPRTGAMHGRLVPPLFGPVPNLWAPLYCRVRPSLVLTPVEADAGADMTFEYGPLAVARAAALAGAAAGAGADMQAAGPPLRQSFRQELGMAEEAGMWDEEGGEGEGAGEELLAGDLPRAEWPAPRPDHQAPLSPFSATPRDYVRVAGPGVYVGCGYPLTPQGLPDRDACVYFLLVRKT